MLINLITPLMIATAPVTVEVPAMNYDHQTQTATVDTSVKLAQVKQLTFNGTRTYASNGRPADNDND